MRILSLAYMFFRQQVRHRVQVVVAVFAVAIILTALILSSLSWQHEGELVRDIGLSAIDFLAFLVVIFGLTVFMYEELEMKSVILLLSKPLRRYEYLLGHYLGLMLTVVINVAFMGMVLGASLLYFGTFLSCMDLLALLYIIYKAALIGALAFLFASFCSSVPLAIILTIFLQVLGHLSFHLHALGRQITSIPLRLLLDGMYFLLPNCYWLDVRERVGLPGFEFSGGYFLLSTAYTLCYTALALYLALYLFRRKQF